MIIASLPRCGATKYCIDLSEKTGLPFVGEYKPLHISGFEPSSVSRKELNHETRYQPLYTHDTFVNVMVDPSKYIVMVNECPHLLVHQSDAIVLRRNMKDAFYSLANLNLRTYPMMKLNVTLGAFFHQMFESLYAMTLYLERYEKSVVWYEDYFNNKPVNTSTLDKHIHKDLVYKYVDTLFEQNDVVDRLNKLQERYI